MEKYFGGKRKERIYLLYVLTNSFCCVKSEAPKTLYIEEACQHFFTMA